MTRTITGWIFILALIFPAWTCDAQDDPIGKVVAVRGGVTALDAAGQKRALSLKAPVFEKDTIETGTGRVQLMFKDNTLITLGRSTVMALTNYVWEPENHKAAMETRIQEGSFRIMGGAITRTAPENFKTTSVSGTIGIRGCLYTGFLQGTKLTTLFHGGKGIFVQNQAGMVEISRPGFATRVESQDQPPTKPEKMSAADLMELEQMLSPQAADQGEEEQGEESDGAVVAGTSEDQTGDGEQGQTEDSQTGPGTSEEDSGSQDTGSSKLSEEPGAFDSMASTGTVADVSSVVEDTVSDATQTNLEEEAQTSAEDQDILNLLQTLGFTGSRSGSVPSTGIWEYSGVDKSALDKDDEPMEMTFVVNWDNGRVFILEDFSTDPGNQGIGFGFGKVSSSGEITDMVVLGSDLCDDGAVFALDGTQTLGHVYGTAQEALGLEMEGYDVNIQDQTQTEYWADILAATLSKTNANNFTGTETWSGFFTGVAEDMSDPGTDRKVFLNDDKSDFSFTINKDTGTFSGRMSGTAVNVGATDINQITIGGNASTSAYIADNLLGAVLSGTNAIESNGSTSALKSYGNYMVTSQAEPLSAYTTWGYWEAAYKDPVTSRDYHIHIPGAFWIAGVATGSAVVQGLINQNFSGTYEGKAQGVMFDANSDLTQLKNGKVTLDINFSAQAALPVSGDIDFDGINLPVTSTTGDLSRTGFEGQITGATTSRVSGAFYGSNAQGMGGNFSALMPNNTRYLGIFAGDR